jgi:hypothetical protein
MAEWIHAEYRDFDVIPRMMVCTDPRGTYFFRSPFDAERNEYADYYEVYRIRPLSDSEACASWFGLETRALARLQDIPVDEFPFDAALRKFLPYDPIAPVLMNPASR